MTGEKPRVLAICHEDPEWILGGMGMSCRGLYKAMARRGNVHVDFLTSGPGEGAQPFCGFTKYQSDKLVCTKPRSNNITAYLYADIQMARTLTQLLADGHRWDVVHEHEWTAVQLGRMTRDALRIPLIGTMHLCISKLMTIEDPDWVSKVKDWGEEEHYLRTQEGHLVCDPNEFVVCSRSYEQTIRETFGATRDINVVHNGIDLDEWNPGAGDGRRAVGVHALGTRPIALYVGRIATMKGIQAILDAVALQDSGWQVVLVGEVNANTEEQREDWEVTKRIRSLEKECPDRFRWLPFQHGQQLSDLYAAADCVLMPSIHEPFGIVALEAMAMGTPLISTEMDGLGEIVVDEDKNEYAMIVSPNSPASIMRALRMMTDDVKAELRELGLRRVRDFSWDAAAAKTERIYQRAIEQNARLQGVA